MPAIHRGHVLHIAGSPDLAEARGHLVSIPDGALAVADDGTIAWVGALRDLPAQLRGWPVGRRTVLAHVVHCSDAELARIAEAGASIAHCPTSQLLLGSGTMPWRRTAAAGVTIALGSDIGAGDEWLIPRVLNDCYKAHLSEPGAASVALHPAELLGLCEPAIAEVFVQGRSVQLPR